MEHHPLRQCRECKVKKLISEFSLDRGVPRRICKACAAEAQSKRYAGQGSAGRNRVLKNWRAHFERDPAKARFILAKSAAGQCGHAWAITLEQFRELNAKPCDYCGGPLPPKGRGLDRLDNSKGYTIDNVVPCCRACNEMRGQNLTPEEMRIVVKALKCAREGKKTSEGGVNPKDLLGMLKPPMELIPPVFEVHVAQAFKNGAKKYSPFNWRGNRVRASIYVGAAKRHIAQWYDGEELAQDSGVHHLAHAAACLAILLDARETGNLFDDRPAPGVTSRLIAEMTDKKLADAPKP